MPPILGTLANIKVTQSCAEACRALACYRNGDMLRVFLLCLFGLGIAPYGPMADEVSSCLESSVVGECRAKATLDDGSLVLESNVQQCSLVEWTLDGERRRSVLSGRSLAIEDAVTFESRRDLRRRVQINTCNEVAANPGIEDSCAALQAEHERLSSIPVPSDLSSPSPISSPSAIRRLERAIQRVENTQRRYNKFVERFVLEAPIGCCIMDGRVCMREGGLERMPLSEW